MATRRRSSGDPTGGARRRVALPWAAAALLLTGSLLVGCTSDKSDGGSSGSNGGSKDDTSSVAHQVNAICKAGKAKTAKITMTDQVVPQPKTEAEKTATKAWATATAKEFDAIASKVADVKADGVEADDLQALSEIYQDAADALRADPGKVLGDVNFLADQDLYDAGYTTCVIPEKPVTTTTTKGG